MTNYVVVTMDDPLSDGTKRPYTIILKDTNPTGLDTIPNYANKAEADKFVGKLLEDKKNTPAPRVENLANGDTCLHYHIKSSALIKDFLRNGAAGDNYQDQIFHNFRPAVDNTRSQEKQDQQKAIFVRTKGVDLRLLHNQAMKDAIKREQKRHKEEKALYVRLYDLDKKRMNPLSFNKTKNEINNYVSMLARNVGQTNMMPNAGASKYLIFDDNKDEIQVLGKAASGPNSNIIAKVGLEKKNDGSVALTSTVSAKSDEHDRKQQNKKTGKAFAVGCEAAKIGTLAGVSVGGGVDPGDLAVMMADVIESGRIPVINDFDQDKMKQFVDAIYNLGGGAEHNIFKKLVENIDAYDATHDDLNSYSALKTLNETINLKITSENLAADPQHQLNKLR